MQVFETEDDELKALLLENASRDKNPEQKVNEASAWEGIEKEDAKKRQALGGGDKISVFAPAVKEIFPEAVNGGQTRDKLAERVGFGSGKTYEAAKNVVKTAKQLKDEGKAGHGQALLKDLITINAIIIPAIGSDGSERAARIWKISPMDRC